MFLPKLEVKSAVIASPKSTGTDSLERKMNISLRPSNPYLLCFRLCTGGSENPDPFSPNEICSQNIDLEFSQKLP